MDVSIIIVNYNTIKLLLDAIDSVYEKSRGFSFEIIVVDNNSSDNSQQIISDKYGEQVKYIALKENIGFGKANNEGVKQAQGACILFLNPDTKLINNAIKILLDYLDTNRGVGIVGGNLYSLNKAPAYSFNKTYSGISQEIVQFLLRPFIKKWNPYPNHNLTDTPISVVSVSGANLLVRKSLLDKYGSFDPAFFMFYEDTELCWRIRKKGYEIVNIPTAKIHHIEGGSFEFKEFKVKLSLESRATFFNKTKGPAYRKLANIILVIILNLMVLSSIITRRDSTYYKKYLHLVKEVYF